MKILAFFLSITVSILLLSAENVPIDNCQDLSSWRFFNGAEFPGATGAISESKNGIAFCYDFSGGGNYVAVATTFPLPDTEVFTIFLEADQPLSVCCRMIDANGRTFHAFNSPLQSRKSTSIRFPVHGPWNAAWGGKQKTEKPVLPIREFQLLIYKPEGDKTTGKVILHELSIETANQAGFLQNEYPVTLKESGWSFTGKVTPLANGVLLTGQAVPLFNNHAAWLEITLPQLGREQIRRYFLLPNSGVHEIRCRLPFPGLFNPRNRYHLKLALYDSTCRNRNEITAILPGRLAADINLGEPRNSRELPNSPFGTNAHFSYARTPAGGPFAVWHRRAELLDKMAECGFKFVRSRIEVDKDKNGRVLNVNAYDLETVRMAHERGLRFIAEIWMWANESEELFHARLRTIVESIRCFDPIYELGNEPNNFGNWRQKYQHKGKTGNWNGFEADGTVSEWVKAHTCATNAAADFIRKLAPEACIIGLGSVPPTNFHALEFGVSSNLDGVVDHPYSYSLPPERIPYGSGFTPRDGIRVGDEQHTFAGLVRSYFEQFQKTGYKRQLWLTEFGFPCYQYNGNNETKIYAGYTELAQAVYLTRRFIESLALPVSGIIQFAMIDSYGGDPYEPEGNFGLLRNDFSPKPAYFAIQRICSLLSGAKFDSECQPRVLSAPLHPGMIRHGIRQWDTAQLIDENGVRLYGFRNPAMPDERILAVWSMLPYSCEFNSRVISFQIPGWAEFSEAPVAIDLMTGMSYDIHAEFTPEGIILRNVPVGEAPLLIKFFRASH